jgi:hypothetical protein
MVRVVKVDVLAAIDSPACLFDRHRWLGGCHKW